MRLPAREDGLVSIDARDDAVHFFIDHWDAGRHSVVFPIRAEVSGAVLSPPPELVAHVRRQSVHPGNRTTADRCRPVIRGLLKIRKPALDSFSQVVSTVLYL